MIHNHEVPSSILGPATRKDMLRQRILLCFYMYSTIGEFDNLAIGESGQGEINIDTEKSDKNQIIIWTRQRKDARVAEAVLRATMVILRIANAAEYA